MWGEGSKDYSEEVIKSYLCKHGSMVVERSGNDLSLNSLGTIHVGGSKLRDFRNRTNINFGRKIASLARTSKLYNYMNIFVIQ